MNACDRTLLVFRLEDARYALDLAVVVRVLPMMEMAVLPLPSAPVLGFVNVGGTVVPVMDLRRRFGLPPRASRLTDVLVLARTRVRTVALAADGVLGLVQRPAIEVVACSAIAPRVPYIEGVVSQDDGLILVHDVDTFLSAGESERLTQALAKAQARP